MSNFTPFLFDRDQNLYWVNGKWQLPPIYYMGTYYLGTIKDCPVMKPWRWKELSEDRKKISEAINTANGGL
jgi:hypothetical protein